MNFCREVLDAQPSGARALVELRRDGMRREWTFGELASASAGFAGLLGEHGVGRGDVVMTIVGSRVEWVLAMVASFRIGAVALACSEQLRPADLQRRLWVARPSAIVVDERNREILEFASHGIDPLPAVIQIPLQNSLGSDGPEIVHLQPDSPALITFTSGTSGQAKAVVHGHRYLTGQALQADQWLGSSAGELVWCTAATGWSKSARNAFLAPWITGAAALLHDGRFDPTERMDIVEREGVTTLCMSPTEYRIIARRGGLRPLPGVRGLVAAGEALDPPTLEAWRVATGVEIRDGYGQTETGQVTAMPPGEPVRPGSMGTALPGVRAWVDDGELVLDPETVPTFFLGYLGEPAPTGPWRTGDRVSRDDDGYFFFEGRADDIIISAGYRIGPDEVESALCSHRSVADAAVIAIPDDERGSVVHAFVVAADGYVGSGTLAGELQDHVKATTAPYKYPRSVEFVAALPRTSTGKLRRAALRTLVAESDEPATAD